MVTIYCVIPNTVYHLPYMINGLVKILWLDDDVDLSARFLHWLEAGVGTEEREIFARSGIAVFASGLSALRWQVFLTKS